MFVVIYQDGSGSVTIDELKEIFGGGKLPENIWKEIIEEVDKNKDGEVFTYNIMLFRFHCKNSKK